MKKSLMSVLALSMAVVACNKDNPNSSVGNGFATVEDINDLKVPASFDWNSTKIVNANITIEDMEGKPMARKRVDVYDKAPYEGGKIIFSSITNSEGKVVQPIKLPSYMSEIYVVSQSFAGLSDDHMKAVSTNGKSINVHFGGIPAQRIADKHSIASYPATAATGLGNVYYLEGTNYNSNGVPNSVIADTWGNDPFPASKIAKYDLLLPEKNHIPCDPVRMAFLNDLNPDNVLVNKEDGEVYVTFVGEGAGQANALAFYYYPAGNKPATPADIDSIFVIFPNANQSYLNGGDRVKLGNFPKNTVVSWVLLGNRFDESTGTLKNSVGPRYFSDKSLNQDMGYNAVGPCPADGGFKEHLVSFKDTFNGNNVIVFSFEDLKYPGGDFDFNDCIFYASGDIDFCCAEWANIPTNIADSDGDGVIDQHDDDPNNPNVACICNYEGKLLYEDLWPAKGDYDFNDMVVKYNVDHRIGANGEMYDVQAEYTIEAVGAGFNNGFGMVLSDDLAKADIASITGNTITGPVVMDGDLVATPGSDLVVYNWDKTNAMFTKTTPGLFFNTVPGGGAGPAEVENVTIAFNAGVEPYQVGVPPYNVFIFANQNYDKEIHLADMPNSSLANVALFGTNDDDSQPGIGRYYKTVAPSNLPWGIDVPDGSFAWPKEKVSILTAYPDFALWASSGGTLNQNWYTNPAAGQTYP